MNSEAGEGIRDSLLQKLVLFPQFLRENGLYVSPAETLDAAHSLLLIDMDDKESFHDAMKATLAKSPEDYKAFDPLFERFWTEPSNPLGRIRPTAEEERASKQFNLNQAGSALSTAQLASVPGASKMLTDVEKNTTPQLLALYSPAESLAKRSFGDMRGEESSLLKRMMKKFARRVATRPGRRLVSSEAGEVNLRKTFRSSLGTGGQLVRLQRERRKISKSNIVLFCDISGSMDSFANELLKLLYIASNTTRRTDAFAFSTRLVRLNRYLEGKSFWNASRAVSENVRFWSSGTRIGSALEMLLAQYPGVLHHYTVFVVISDGWELDSLDVLEANLRTVRSRVSKVIWLNPLADTPGFSPLTGGMKRALPFIDILAGLKIFADRREFERVMGKSIEPLTP